MIIIRVITASSYSSSCYVNGLTSTQERAEAEWRRARAEGRLMLSTKQGGAKAAERAGGGAIYQLLATDPDAQFA